MKEINREEGIHKPLCKQKDMSSNKKKTTQLATILMLNILLILGAILAINQYIKTSIDEVTVYKFSTSLPPDTKINEGDVVAVKVASKMVANNTVRDKSTVVGKYTSESVYEGELVDTRKIVGEGQVNPLEALPANEAALMRKISLPVDLISTWGGSLGKGDRVDLSYTGKTEDGATYTKIFMQNVLVYDVLSSAGESYIKPEDRPPIVIDQSNPESAELAQAEIARRSDLVMAILAVTPEQYEEIRNRLATGTVNLVGRFDVTKNYATDGYADQEIKNPSMQGQYEVEDKDAVLIKEQSKTGTGW